MEYIICHYHEIALKGKNRRFFEEKLIENIKRSLSKGSFEFVKRISGRIIVRLKKNADEKKMEKALKNVFGIAYFAFANSTKQDISFIKKGAESIFKDKKFKSFKIDTKRSEKPYKYGSQKVNEIIGEHVVKKLKKKVNLTKPAITCFIEIVEKYAFLYTKKIKGMGGLPVGVSSKGIVLISGGIDSPVAAFYTLKRGMKTIFVHFHAMPFTDKASIDKVKRLVKILNKFQFGSKIYLVPFSDIQEEILLKAPAKFRVILYRRFMLYIAEQIAKKAKAKALITGDSLGQVASQTLENIGVINEAVGSLILRPLIGQDKEEIIKTAKQIGTFDISILPHQDCCARFLPSKPETKANLKEVKLVEKKINIKKFVSKALEKTKVFKI
jgi:thiamine biosynthesis protein ThiI